MLRGQCHVQGHALFTRQAGGLNPCPQIDFTGGFNSFMAAAFGIESVQGTYGQPFSKLLLLAADSPERRHRSATHQLYCTLPAQPKWQLSWRFLDCTVSVKDPEGSDVILLSRADPFLNDQNYVLSVLTLEELGATGNKVRLSRPALPSLPFTACIDQQDRVARHSKVTVHLHFFVLPFPLGPYSCEE